MVEFQCEPAFDIPFKRGSPEIRHYDGIGGRIETAGRHGKILGRYFAELNGHFVLRMNNHTRQNKAACD
jgi:hypothetical protein